MPGRPVKIRHLYTEQQIHVAEAVRFAHWCLFYLPILWAAGFYFCHAHTPTDLQLP